MSEKTKKPTGLTIGRSNYKFTLGWKIADADHGSGQKLKYKIHYNKTNSEKSVKLTNSQTSTTFTINKANYYPTKSNVFLKKVTFKVSGKRKPYKNKRPGWSDFASKEFTINEPYNPILTQALADNSDITTVFSWTCNVSNDDHRMFTDYEWWTKLTSNGKSPNWSKGHIVKNHADGIDGDTGGSDTGYYEDTTTGAVITWNISKDGGSVTIREDSAKVLLGPGSTSYTRSFRIRARGPAGASDWVATQHVYAYPKTVKKIYHDQKDINAAMADIKKGQNLIQNGVNIARSEALNNKTTTASSNLINKGSTLISKAYNNLEKHSGAIMTTRKKKASGSVVKLSWDCDINNGHPIDYCEVEYCIVEPVVTRSTSGGKVTSTISCPGNGFPGTIAGKVYDSTGWSSYSFILPNYVPDNQMMFIRVNTWHDNKVNYGEIFPVINSAGDLSAPTGLSYVDIRPDTHKIEITTPTNNCPIAGSFIVIYFRSNKKADLASVVGIIPWENSGSGNTILTIPAIDDDDSPSLGMQTFVGNYSPASPQPNTTAFSVEGELSSDGIDWSAGVVPMPPTLNIKRVDSNAEMVLADWDWRWSQANAAELSWSTNPKAWQSTEEPSRYIVSGINSSDWYISGLNPAMWYFRCRLLQQNGNNVSYGSYSKIADCDLATDPYRPIVQSDSYTVVAGDPFTLYWSFSNEDSSGPDSADITFCPLNGSGEPIPNPNPFREKVDFKGKYDQTIKLSTGKTKYYDAFPVGGLTYIAVRTRSATGKVSDWSEPVGITIAEKLTASITQTSFSSESIFSYTPTEDTQLDLTKTYYRIVEDEYIVVINPVIDDISEYYERIERVIPNTLTELPLRVTVAGNGDAGTSSITITRVEDYILRRPELKTNELPYNGFAGETIAIQSITGSGEITIDKSDLIGTLDDGEKYLMTATLVDSYGQTAETSIEFEVHWAVQALMPSAEITPNVTELITLITPTASENVREGDVVDIYRLSADAPELIIQGGSFGTTYVDPYPTLGEFGGHRIIFRTANGDFITDQNQLAMVDYLEDNDDVINYFAIVIDFAGEQIRLPYDINVSNKWAKDFTEVKYLGGSVKGYWNPAVSRTSSLNTTVVIEDDPNGHDLIMAMRRLANYAGVCHIRTPDGSSYSANINVNEDREERWVTRLAKFSLDITKVNPEGFEGMTLLEWEEEA